jgi:hypothetical protein
MFLSLHGQGSNGRHVRFNVKTFIMDQFFLAFDLLRKSVWLSAGDCSNSKLSPDKQIDLCTNQT